MAERPRLDSLTSLRWFAAFGVFVFHAATRSGLHGPALLAANFGFDGVSFFFVLSGFVLAWSQGNIPAHRFYRNRFARVWPLHAFTWTLVVLFGLGDDPISGPGALVSRGSLAGYGLLQGWRPLLRLPYLDGNGPSWTLSCEMFFYLLFPLAIPLVRRVVRSGEWRRVLVVVAISVAGWDFAAFHSLTRGWANYATQPLPAARFSEFLIGCLLASAMQAGWRPHLRPAQAVALLAASALAVALAGGAGDRSLEGLVTPLLLPAVAGIICAFAAAELESRPLLCHPWLVTLGQWSFAFYLVHWWVLNLCFRGHAVPNAGLGLLALALSIVLAGAAHIWIERPLERLIRTGRRRRTPALTLVRGAPEPA